MGAKVVIPGVCVGATSLALCHSLCCLLHVALNSDCVDFAIFLYALRLFPCDGKNKTEHGFEVERSFTVVCLYLFDVVRFKK